MKPLLRTFAYSFICLFVYLLIPLAKIFASGEFQADYNVQYAVAPSGITIVTQNISLTNLQTNLYPQKYSITIDSTNIRNVISYDSGGVVPTEIKQKDGKTEILLTFNEKNVGLGKKLEFSLRYESTDIATLNGAIWEVNIPGVAQDPDLSTYIVSLRVPATFGPNAYMSPLPASSGRWTKEQMTRGGISAAYGKVQQFDVTLSYFLENPSVTSTISEIALPPDTAYQKVIIHSLEPKPKTVLRDMDGNWLAQYDLLPAQKLSIQADLTVQVSLAPLTTEPVTLSQSDRKFYTKPLKYWEADNSEIQKLAQQYTTPRSVYNYVVSALVYDYQRAETAGPRKGAIGALASPRESICMEFTDIFIAIARAAGIPARESVGYAYTNNARLRPLSLVADVLHAWPEYYNDEEKRWIPIDPTWANTTGGINYFDKLDFNHITFAILGQSSEYPYPAGFYKKTGIQSKDVNVRFSTKRSETLPPELLTVQYQFPSVVTAGLPARGSLFILNDGTTLIPKAMVNIETAPIDLNIMKELTNIPPFSRISIPLDMDIPNYFQKRTGSVITQVNGKQTQYTFTIEPLFIRFIIPVSIIGVSSLILLYIWLRTHSVWKRHRK